MIKLFQPLNYIKSQHYNNLLHDDVVKQFETLIANYVGAKYAVSFNSATSAIFLALTMEKLNRNKTKTITVPSIIPPVVCNAIIHSGFGLTFKDDIDWVGNSYILHDFGAYKIIDSAQKLIKNQFAIEANDNDLMIFSHYPTKPVGSCDGGTIVSNDKNKIDWLLSASINGTSSMNCPSWERKILFPGWKMYMNAIQASIAIRNFNTLEDRMKTIDSIRTHYNTFFSQDNKSQHLYRINVKDNVEWPQRALKADIECGIHYRPVHLEKVYSKYVTKKLPRSENNGKTTISLPFNSSLTETDIKYVCEFVKKNN